MARATAMIVAMVACTTAGMATVGAAAAGKPNILYLMADDLNADWKNDRHQVRERVCSYVSLSFSSFHRLFKATFRTILTSFLTVSLHIQFYASLQSVVVSCFISFIAVDAQPQEALF